MLEDIKNAVERFGETSHGTRWCFVIKKEFIDGIDKWLHEYTRSADGDWLDYSIEQVQNDEFAYVLILFPSW